ncbi:protein GRAVITROPIC IN THE LIGHT 1-like isoform X1 [Camellia sinensis]|uniref:protein GRAVITROPIC IN THE LIGHT 1-like isoform X1 n=2 Tax=Camellia sinensis TaxID=4442 RepID=UPI001036E1C5|nr:protein GRAVITROPIC IN THE LIGHT 1-like isoform X1 [Camellia sinensis]
MHPCIIAKMDSVDRKSVTPSKSRLARTFAKVLHVRAVTGVASVDGIQKTKSHEKVKHDHRSEKVKHDRHMSDWSESFDCDDEKLRHRAAVEAFLAKLFASISTVKAAYAQLQFAQSPYDAGGIQAADQVVVSELKNLSELKQCYLKKQLDESSPEKTHLLADLQEQKSLLKTYEIMGKKLDSQLKLKNSEITFLQEKLEEANRENKLLEKRLNSSGLIPVPDNLHLSGLSPNHFIVVLQQTTKSIRNFVRLMINEMELAGWDLDAAANTIEPGVRYCNANHKCYAFESFVCREMFDGFNYPYFSLLNESLSEQQKWQRLFFDRFTKLKSMKTREYLVRKPKSTFAKFCSGKYLRLVHPKMESSLFGNLNQRNLVKSGEHPETTFFAIFTEMAKRVWLLHCLAFSFEPEASVFQVGKKCRFSEVYMESVSEESFLSTGGTMETDPLVAFTVVPGFKIGKTVIQCQVYLS